MLAEKQLEQQWRRAVHSIILLAESGPWGISSLPRKEREQLSEQQMLPKILAKLLHAYYSFKIGFRASFSRCLISLEGKQGGSAHCPRVWVCRALHECCAPA